MGCLAQPIASPRGFEPENGDHDVARPEETTGKDAGRDTTAHDAGEPSHDRPGPAPVSDPVEAALAKAVELAAAAGEWSAVAELGRELAARRLARQAPGVATLDAARERRRR